MRCPPTPSLEEEEEELTINARQQSQFRSCFRSFFERAFQFGTSAGVMHQKKKKRLRHTSKRHVNLQNYSEPDGTPHVGLIMSQFPGLIFIVRACKGRTPSDPRARVSTPNFLHKAEFRLPLKNAIARPPSSKLQNFVNRIKTRLREMTTTTGKKVQFFQLFRLAAARPPLENCSSTRRRAVSYIAELHCRLHPLRTYNG